MISFVNGKLLIIFAICLHFSLKFVSGQTTTFKMEIRASAPGAVTDKNSTQNLRIVYREGLFNNIPNLIEHTETLESVPKGTLNQLCAKGVWIFYNSPYFSVKNGTIKGISLMASIDLLCLSLADQEFMQMLSSTRPLTLHDFHYSYIVMFTGLYFQGEQEIIGGRSIGPRAKDGFTIGSLVVKGKMRWTLVLDNDKKYCIRPKMSENAVCLLSNFVDNKQILAGAMVKYVRKHCQKNATHEIQLTECYEIGDGYIRPIKPTGPFGAPLIAGNGTGGGEITNPNATAEREDCKVENTNDILTSDQKFLIEGRLNGSLLTGQWMRSLAHVVDTEYIILVASLFFHHWDKAIGNDSNFESLDFGEMEWMEISHDVEECVNAYKTRQYVPSVEISLDKVYNYKQLSDLTDDIESMFGLRPEYDYVLELNWIFANVAASLCHDFYHGSHSFLTKFWNAYHPLYFSPIIGPWKNPTNVTMAYKYVFGGYGMEKTFAKMGYCAAQMLTASQAMEPYTRPFEQTTTSLLPKFRGHRGEIEEEAVIPGAKPKNSIKE